MPMSSHQPLSNLQTPTPPTMAHASPASQQPPPQHSNLPSTPSTPNTSRLTGMAGAFVPKKPIILKTVDGQLVDLDKLRRHVGPSPVSADPQSPSIGNIEHTGTPARPVVRRETLEQKRAREATEREVSRKEREGREKEKRAKEDDNVVGLDGAGSLNIKEAGENIPQSFPSALSHSRAIDDIRTLEYPEGIQPPERKLNVNAIRGKFKYDRDFLLQFMAVCKDKPDNLAPLEALGLELSHQQFSVTRSGSGRRASGLVAPSSRSNSIGSAFYPIGKAGAGQYAMPAASKLSSEERFAMAGRSVSALASSVGVPPTGVAGFLEVSKFGGPGGVRKRTRSSRGHARKKSTIHQPALDIGPSLETVVPLESSATRWAPMSTILDTRVDSPEVVGRRVKVLLNKLTMDRFDSISDEIIEWANKSEKDRDGRTLFQVIRLVFEKATDEVTFGEMYARLCRKMMEQISTKVQDDGILNNEGKPFAGGQLFRKYLLNRCQEDFEQGWAAKNAAVAAVATAAKAGKPAVKEEAGNRRDGDVCGDDSDFELYSDEYYAATKAKRRRLGLIRFIGELFKLQMLTERIMHECIRKLLSNVENPEEEDIESLCELLITVGSIIDTPEARTHMDIYFSRMKALAESKNVNANVASLLTDVIELRKSKWQPRSVAVNQTAKQVPHDNHIANPRSNSMALSWSRRDSSSNDGAISGPDTWAITSPDTISPRLLHKADDIHKFGQINKPQPMTFGPNGVSNAKKDGAEVVREGNMSRTASVSRNMFDMLSAGVDTPEAPTATKFNMPPRRKPTVDLYQVVVSDGAP